MIKFSLLRLLPSAGLKNGKSPFKGEAYVPSEALTGGTSAADNLHKEEGERRFFGPSPALMSFYKKHENAVRRSKK